MRTGARYPDAVRRLTEQETTMSAAGVNLDANGVAGNRKFGFGAAAGRESNVDAKVLAGLE